MVKRYTRKKRRLLDKYFKLIGPGYKVHGFGTGSVELIVRYPWHSCDSTSWRKVASNGNIYVPKWQDGDWVYDQTPWIINVSYKRSFKPGHITTILDSTTRRLVWKYVKSQGFDMEELMQNHNERSRLNIHFCENISPETKFYFAGCSPGALGELHDPLPITNRLMSYYHIREDNLEMVDLFNKVSNDIMEARKK
jgi:hypothetical protein